MLPNCSVVRNSSRKRPLKDSHVNRAGFDAHLLRGEGRHHAKQVRPGDPGEGDLAGHRSCAVLALANRMESTVHRHLRPTTHRQPLTTQPQRRNQGPKRKGRANDGPLTPTQRKQATKNHHSRTCVGGSGLIRRRRGHLRVRDSRPYLRNAGLGRTVPRANQALAAETCARTPMRCTPAFGLYFSSDCPLSNDLIRRHWTHAPRNTKTALPLRMLEWKRRNLHAQASQQSVAA